MNWMRAQHEQDLMDAVNILVGAWEEGDTNVTIEFETSVSQEEIEQVYREASRRIKRKKQ